MTTPRKPARKPGTYRKAQIGVKNGSMIWMTREQASKLDAPRPHTKVVDSKIAKGDLVAFAERRSSKELRKKKPLLTQPGHGPFTMHFSTAHRQLQEYIVMTRQEYADMLRRSKTPAPTGRRVVVVSGKKYVAFPSRRQNPA